VRHPAHEAHDEATPLSVRLAEQFAGFLGSVRFIIGQTCFVIAWITLNTWHGWGNAWDTYPFILLNLAFSTQAAYAAPLILLAQNRQSQVDRQQAAHDYATNQEALKVLHAIHGHDHGEACRCWDQP
jgi:uncharacterized membrane protein